MGFLFKIFVISFFIYASLSAHSDEQIRKVCAELKLIPASKAIVQWERVFSSEKRMNRYAIHQLSPDVQQSLKAYLIKHAADSAQPMVPGL